MYFFIFPCFVKSRAVWPSLLLRERKSVFVDVLSNSQTILLKQKKHIIVHPWINRNAILVYTYVLPFFAAMWTGVNPSSLASATSDLYRTKDDYKLKFARGYIDCCVEIAIHQYMSL